MSVKERILTIRLMEKALKMPDKAERLGILVNRIPETTVVDLNPGKELHLCEGQCC